MLVHTIWIQDPSSTRTFGVGEWISVKSLLQNTSYRVVLHTNLEPGQAGHFDPYTINHDRLLINRRPYDLTVCGVRLRPANLSDMERIRVLHESGGIYADLDIWWMREVDLTSWGPIVTAYENPSYKTVANAFIAAKIANWEPFRQLLSDMEARLTALAARGITDLRGDPVAGLSKNHTFFWKQTGDFFKANAVDILGRTHFYKNGWRRIGRELQRMGVALNPVVVPQQLGSTADRISLAGIDGFHYYAGLFTPEQVLQISLIRDTFSHLV